MRRPIALWPGQKRCASAAVTITLVARRAEIGGTERAAFDQAQADRLDVAGRHTMQEGARTIGGVDRAHALSRIENRALAAKRNRRCERGVRDAGKSAQIFQQRQRRRARIDTLPRLGRRRLRARYHR